MHNPWHLSLVSALLFTFPLAGHGSPSDLANMVQAEYDFAAMAKREGYKASFLKYLSDDAVMFVNGPIAGRKRISERPDLPGQLQWYPAYAVVASTGDVGLSTGPWVYVNQGKPAGYGHFLSIWRKRADGSWINVLDVGIDHEEMKPPPEKLQMSSNAIAAQADTANAKAHSRDAPASHGAQTSGGAQTRNGAVAAPRDADTALREAERQFAQLASTSGYAAAAERVAHDDLRVYRSGHVPVSGAASAASFLKEQSAVGAPKLEYASGSGDFGYTYGPIAKAQGAGASHWFVHVWKKENGKWLLLTDLMTPLVEPKAE
jgi:ketosteroid isomerase-like protein